MPIGRKRGQLIPLTDRQKNARLNSKSVAAGARQDKACDVIGLSTRMLHRWRIDGVIVEDKRPTATRPEPLNKLSAQERQAVIDVCKDNEFASLPPSQIVPILADRGEYLASESSFYRIVKAENMLHHRGKAKARNSHARPTSYTAKKANEVWSWDISYLPTSVIGQHYYLYMIENIYSRKVVGCEVHYNETGEKRQSCFNVVCGRKVLKNMLSAALR